MDPWAAALDAMFMGPGSDAATYQPLGGAPRPIRVIRSAPDRTTGFGDGRIINQSTSFEIRVSDVPAPERGDFIFLGDEAFELFGDPIMDLERLSHTCGAEPAD